MPSPFPGMDPYLEAHWRDVHAGGYEDTLDYAAEPDPPLLGADRDWAGEWLREKELRPLKKPQRRKQSGDR